MSEPFRLNVLGGLGEIGMNCLAIESRGEILFVDCGLQFTELEDFSVDYYVPNFPSMLPHAAKIKGYVITHGHEDHMGALPYAFRAGLVAPIFASPFTLKLIEERFRDQGVTLPEGILRPYLPGARFRVGRAFEIEGVAVNHSILEAAALIIRTPDGNLVHTGDFRVDPQPFIGKEMDFEPFRKVAEEGVLLLMSDSTNVERHSDQPSEQTVFEGLLPFLADAPGLSVVTLFASNVGRVGQVLEISKKLGKKVALAGRSMINNARIARECGYLSGTESCLVDLENIMSVPRSKAVVLASGCQGEHQSAVMRMALGEHRFVDLEPSDRVVFSSKFIPGNEKAIGRTINHLYRVGVDVVYDPMFHVHVSGHATRPELKRMLQAVKPKFFLPVHGEYRHLVQHAQLALECGIPEDRILVAENGEHIELTSDAFEVVQHVDEYRVMIEGPLRKEIQKEVVKERRKLGLKGCLNLLLLWDSDRKRVIAGPEFWAHGIMDEARWKKAQPKLIDWVKKQVHSHRKEEAGDLAETLRIELRRLLKEQMGEKPVVHVFLKSV